MSTTAQEEVKSSGLNREAVSEIQRMMREKGYSRSDLARLLNINRVNVTQMLKPTARLSLARIERIARKMGYTIHLSIAKQIETRYRGDDQER